jgi:hypothetical protein
LLIWLIKKKRANSHAQQLILVQQCIGEKGNNSLSGKSALFPYESEKKTVISIWTGKSRYWTDKSQCQAGKSRYERHA